LIPLRGGAESGMIASIIPDHDGSRQVSGRVRQAVLDDTAAISGLFRAGVSVWQRWRDGRVEDVPYDQLTLGQRWHHGAADEGASGAWMSVETGAIWLNALLHGAGLPLVVTDAADRPLAYAETFINNEPAPFGAHVHWASFAPADAAPELIAALLQGLRYRAWHMGCPLLTINRASADADDPVMRVIRSGSQPLTVLELVYRWTIPARTGQVFYQATEHHDADPLQISGWGMPLGRIASPRWHWEALWPTLWDTLPALRERRQQRLHLTAGGIAALVLAQQSRYDRRTVEIALWTPQPFTTQMVTALRDWAYRSDYRTLSLIAGEAAAAVIGAGAERDAYQQQISGVSTR